MDFCTWFYLFICRGSEDGPLPRKCSGYASGYVHHYTILTAKARNESSVCGIVTYESAAMNAVRSLALDGSPGIYVNL